MGAVWLPRRITGPVVVVVGPVVVGSALVVVASVVVVVGSTVVVGAVVVVGVVAVVVGCTVVVGAVVVGWVVVAPDVDGAWVVVVTPAVVGIPVVAGGVVVVGPLRARGTVSGVVADGAGEAVGSWKAVLVDADVGGSAGEVGSATPGARRGGGGGGDGVWWGTRAAEATTAARTAAVSPKANSSSRQGRRGGARCRGRRIGIVASSPVRLVLPADGVPLERVPLPAAEGVAAHKGLNGAFVVVGVGRRRPPNRSPGVGEMTRLVLRSRRR